MTVKEFNAWLEGFSESIKDAPNKKQWEKIKARIKEIEPDKEVEVVRVDGYNLFYPRPWYPVYTYGTVSFSSTGTSTNFSSTLESQAYNVGKIEAEAVSAEL